MKLAVVINVGHEPAELKHALDTQNLLLEKLGARLDSIRLAVPRLLHNACTSALAEEPDILVAVGGPRSARRAGQLAHACNTPVLFLPGLRAANWARCLWGSLTLDDMVVALARGDLLPVQLGIGTAVNQLFFERACCGLLPHLPELRGAMEDADTFGETWQVLARAGDLSRSLFTRKIRFRSDDGDVQRASALIVETKPAAQTRIGRETRPVFKCTALQHGAFGLAGNLLRSSLGIGLGEGLIRQFESASLLVEAGRPSWILLDGDPVRFDGPVEFGFAPGALRTFLFNPVQEHANDNPRERAMRFRAFDPDPEPKWNFPAVSHVAMNENRESGDRKRRKQV